MIKNKNLRLYETLAHERAMDAAERRELTADQQALSNRMLAFAHGRLNETERAIVRPRKKVRASIAAMDRPSLLLRLADVLTLHPGAVFAHRDLSSLSDDDLKTALEDAETMIEQMA